MASKPPKHPAKQLCLSPADFQNRLGLQRASGLPPGELVEENAAPGHGQRAENNGAQHHESNRPHHG